MYCKLIAYALLGIVTSCHSQEYDDDIILVDIENNNRSEIANAISLIRELDPKVIAIDVQFIGQKGEGDLSLMHALEQCESLVMTSFIQGYGEDHSLIVNGSDVMFIPPQAILGFTNVIYDENEMFRNFIASHKSLNRKLAYHFSVCTAISYDSARAMEYVKKMPAVAAVDYKDGTRKFRKISMNDILTRKSLPVDVKGKAVIIGAIGPGEEDKFITPLNRSGPNKEPDMYGVEILANIVAQVLGN